MEHPWFFGEVQLRGHPGRARLRVVSDLARWRLEPMVSERERPLPPKHVQPIEEHTENGASMSLELYKKPRPKP